MLEILKILYCIPFLIYSCYSDIKTRRVKNNTWLVMLLGGVFFAGYDFLSGGAYYLKSLAISFIFIFILVYLFFQIGTFGGADAKLLIVLSIIFPIFPIFEFLGYNFPINKPLNLFALSVLGNSVLLTIIVPFCFAIYNVIKMELSLKNIGYIFLGYKSKISSLANKHIKLIHEYEEIDGKVKLKFKRGGVKIDDDIIHKLEELHKKGLIKDEVWVTPGLPFMIPLTLGFFVGVIYGDMIFELTKFWMMS